MDGTIKKILISSYIFMLIGHSESKWNKIKGTKLDNTNFPPFKTKPSQHFFHLYKSF